MTTTTDSSLQAALYPPLEPQLTGRLDVGDGHQLYWEECGNPSGRPVVFVHGGPGGGCSPIHRRYFDPARYRIVLVDQRGCGRSTPHASEPFADLSHNTTWHLVADLERLRVDRAIESWQVFGGSWGSSLALAYAQTHPEAVTELVLRGIFTLRRSELDWYYNGGAGNLAPQWWQRFEAPLRARFGDLSDDFDRISGYHELLFDPDPAVHGPAGVAWTTWEAATSTLVFDQAMVDDYSDPDFALAFARIENHYFVHAGWLTDGQLIANVDLIRHLPTVIVQGAYDLPCPAITAWQLHQAWPEADFRLVLAGHAVTEPAIADELVAATDRFARRGD